MAEEVTHPVSKMHLVILVMEYQLVLESLDQRKKMKMGEQEAVEMDVKWIQLTSQA